MIQEQYIEDIIITAIQGIDFSQTEFTSLRFLYGNYDNLKLILNQGWIDKTTQVEYPVLIYILPEPSKVNLENKKVIYRTGNPTLYLMNVSNKDYTWEEFKTNVLDDLATLKILFLESLNKIATVQKLDTIDEYIHKWLSIQAKWLSSEDLFSLEIGGYELNFELNINKKFICNG